MKQSNPLNFAFEAHEWRGAADGTLRLNYSKSGKDYLVEGPIKFTKDDEKIEGRVTFFTNGTAIGTGEFLINN
jgi:hypothetical protein